MKIILLPVVIVLVVAAAATVLPAQYVEDHETISQVLWNEREAFLFAGVRRVGWSGSYGQFAMDLLRGGFGKIPDYQPSKEWVVVARITPSRIQKHIESNTSFFHPQPFEGGIFRGGNPVLKLVGTSFLPVSSNEHRRFHERGRASAPNYDKVEGWSSRMNLLNQDDLRVEVVLQLEGGEVTLVAERSKDRSRKQIIAKLPNAGTQEVFAITEEPRFVDRAEYESLVARD